MQLIISLLIFLLSFSAQSTFSTHNSEDSALNPILKNNKFLPIKLAVPFNFYQKNNQIFLNWKVKKNYYLYQSSISITGNKIAIRNIEMPQGQLYTNEFLEEIHIYSEPLMIKVPLYNYQKGAHLVVQYQSCAKTGFCYPPETHIVPIKSFRNNTLKPKEKNTTTQIISNTQQNHLANKLAKYWWTPLLFFVLGFGLAFTPCVLPMYPILTTIILGNNISHTRALALSFTYVQGMALTYSLLGLTTASLGIQFQATMQHPYALITLSTIFVALAASMFGLYNLQLPNNMQVWVRNISNNQKSSSAFRVFNMGVISGLVCSPCTTPPLSGALLYLTQSGDIFTGGISLYALGTGMGTPLMLTAVLGNKLLPKTSAWNSAIKVLLGFLLLAMCIFLLERILQDMWITVLWSLLGLTTSIWLYYIKNKLLISTWKQNIIVIIAISGLFISAQPTMNFFFQQKKDALINNEQKIEFTQINNIQELEEQVFFAKKEKKSIMLDFYSDWCVACKALKQNTFDHFDVKARLKTFVLLQANITKNSSQSIGLTQHMNVLGLPTIEFWNSKGEHIPNARITGFIEAEAFLKHLRNHKL
ncbi:thiol:disulfide interchange protein [Candidatus Photodesmus blepharus]|uniref:Thiol:disulfide interchange protein DsbD n=1 Tax=Candidatus Photodesmus blepharonis TaxID=1179155 RepID=A0A084CN80_9GAMM|nr:protein-disulfide reductase DsbD [Candidatus Photodesmus blepharus]KEY91259.1 thiol:disulfide interchange protein [Candidatus Photodesmus blepharus]